MLNKQPKICYYSHKDEYGMYVFISKDQAGKGVAFPVPEAELEKMYAYTDNAGWDESVAQAYNEALAVECNIMTNLLSEKMMKFNQEMNSTQGMFGDWFNGADLIGLISKQTK